MKHQPLFTAMVHTFNRPELLKLSVEALQRQTYSNLEIILINNGAIPEIVEYINDIASLDNRVKLLHFQENQYSVKDPLKYVHVCWNAALSESTGEYVWVQQDDDILADDYAEKMVALFQGDPECTTAAGLPVSIGIDGRVNEVINNEVNLRSRYSDGREIAWDYLLGSQRLFSAPGTIFTIKRDVLIEAGGYHRAIEDSQIYGIVPFGTTGFDPTALFYWRHHDGQHNRQLTRTGDIGIDNALALLNDWQLEQRWRVFGADIAREVVRSYKRKVNNGAARWFVINLYAFRLRPAFRIMQKAGTCEHFWIRALAHALNPRFFVKPIAPVIAPPLKALFRIVPGLAKLTPELSAKADRWI